MPQRQLARELIERVVDAGRVAWAGVIVPEHGAARPHHAERLAAVALDIGARMRGVDEDEIAPARIGRLVECLAVAEELRDLRRRRSAAAGEPPPAIGSGPPP